jgi:hypothetical protein
VVGRPSRPRCLAYIASGRAISPPSTVNDFPSAIGYWLVQVIILAPALGIAALVAARQANRISGPALARPTGIAIVTGTAVAIVIIELGFVAFPHEGGTQYLHHHSSDGSPPLIGLLGLLLSFATCAILGGLALRRRHASRRHEAASLVPAAEASRTA